MNLADFLRDFCCNDHLRNFREGHGMTQKELAEKIDVRVNYLSDIETGQRAISIATP